MTSCFSQELMFRGVINFRESPGVGCGNAARRSRLRLNEQPVSTPTPEMLTALPWDINY